MLSNGHFPSSLMRERVRERERESERERERQSGEILRALPLFLSKNRRVEERKKEDFHRNCGQGRRGTLFWISPRSPCVLSPTTTSLYIIHAHVGINLGGVYWITMCIFHSISPRQMDGSNASLIEKHLPSFSAWGRGEFLVSRSLTNSLGGGERGFGI